MISAGEGDKDDDPTNNEHNRTEMSKTLAQLIFRFKLDWKVLRAIMWTTGAVISGSAALAILLRGEFVPQNLDICVTSDNVALVLVYLQDQGYKIQIPATSDPKPTYSKSTITLNLESGAGEKVNLIATTESHVVHTISRFNTTCVMNFVSYYGVVCLYPEWTLRKASLVRVATEETDKQAIFKYRGRGFTMVEVAAELPDFEQNHWCDRHQHCPKTRREVHDHSTLCIPLEDETLSIQTEEKERVEWVFDENYECA